MKGVSDNEGRVSGTTEKRQELDETFALSVFKKSTNVPEFKRIERKVSPKRFQNAQASNDLMLQVKLNKLRQIR